MGFFDLFSSKNNQPAQSSVAKSAAASVAVPVETTQPVAPSAVAPVKPLLANARARLDAQDLPGALAIYEEVLRASGERGDVLVTISGELGASGHLLEMLELVAPYYDAQRHGPATGMNLLQGYLATRNTQGAQHILDVLFALGHPELEERLHGFSNALGELIEAIRKGQLEPANVNNGSAQPAVGATIRPSKMINLVSISKPIWSYGVEAAAGVLPPAKSDRLRRVAFGQLSLLGVEDFAEKMKQPEDELARFSRGFPLWLAETFYFSPQYNPIAAVGLVDKLHMAIFPAEWTPENIRQLVDTCTGGLDYVFTGALMHNSGEFQLVIRVWEAKKLRERKQFSARWTAATADAELLKLHEQIRLFMEWQSHTGATVYAMPAKPLEWCHSLGTSLALFLVDKGVLPISQLASPSENLARLAEKAAGSEKDAVVWLTAQDRARRIGLPDAPNMVPPVLADGPLVKAARATLGS